MSYTSTLPTPTLKASGRAKIEALSSFWEIMMSGNKDEAKAGQQGDASNRQAQSGVHSNFAHASPESMVNPPGAAQSGAGSIAGKDDVPGGVSSQIQASRNAQSSAGPAAAGGNPGTPADDGRYGVNSSGGAGMDRDS